jgi:DNA-binding transcriptional MerR regulator
MLIGEFAERTGLSQRTIRHYDQIKVLEASGRSDSGYRFYTSSNLDQARDIRSMRALGLSHDEIREALKTLDLVESDPDASVTTIRRDLAAMIADVELRARALRERLCAATDFVQMLRGL